MNFPAQSFGEYHVRVLRHVPGPVDLSVMSDVLLDSYPVAVMDLRDINH